MAIRNLLFLRNFLLKPKAFGQAIFGQHLPGVQNPVIFQSCVVGLRTPKVHMFDRSPGGGWGANYGGSLHSRAVLTSLGSMTFVVDFADVNSAFLFGAMLDLDLACLGSWRGQV